jgi:hypothetical protein
MPASPARRAATADRRRRAVALRIAGHNWQTIADRLEYKSKGAACTDVTRALAQNVADLQAAAEEHRAIELSRLDALQAACWRAAMQGDTRAIDTCVRIIAARSRLLGLEAPQCVAVIALSVLDAEILRLEAELGHRGQDGQLELEQ